MVDPRKETSGEVYFRSYKDQHISILNEVLKIFFEEALQWEEESVLYYMKKQEEVLEVANDEIVKLRKQTADIANTEKPYPNTTWINR